MMQINTHNTFLIISLIALSILSFATLTNYLLKKIKPENETFKKVQIIINSWWKIISILLVFMSWETWGLTLLSYLITIYITIEYFNRSKINYKTYSRVSLIFISTVLHLSLVLKSTYFYYISTPLLCLLLVPPLVVFKATIKDLELVVSCIFGIGFSFFYISHIPALLTMHDQLGFSIEQASISVLVLVLITWGNDVFQFISGKSFGKTKIVPLVSPNKTLGGFIGGILCSTALTTLAGTQLLNLSLIECLIIGPVISAMGMFGDLFYSAVKRNLEIKDFSDLLPGHGGILDRIDSLIFTAPIFFHLLKWLHGT